MKRFNIAKNCLYLLGLGKINPEKKYHVNTNKTREISANAQAGFTLIEALVVLLMIGVLAAIAAPSWIAFINSQRLTTVNDAVARAIQKAQREAKAKAVSYSVSFRVNNNLPEFAVYPTFDASSKNSSLINPNTNKGVVWQKLGIEVSSNVDKNGDYAEEKQILLCTNLAIFNPSAKDLESSDANKIGGFSCKPSNLANARTITFDYNGALAPDSDPDVNENQPITIAVTSVANSSNYDAGKPTTSRRCTQIRTLLGAMQTAQNTECPVS